MRVYKFGGASVKSAEAVRNLTKIVAKQDDSLIVVVSAMDKITNALEQVHQHHKTSDIKLKESFAYIKKFHNQIAEQLFENRDHNIFDALNLLYTEIEIILNQPPSENSAFDYDRLVCYGELISTRIVADYLKYSGLDTGYFDIRKVLRTDNTYREARVNWDISAKLISKYLIQRGPKVIVTQGFIGCTSEGLSTTLGREGSDFSAAILAYLLNAEDVTIWKDVPGIMNADPVWYKNAEKIDKLSYEEAIELAFYGAKVIHPRTVKPLQNKKIPLRVKSFISPQDSGTTIEEVKEKTNLPPIYILKNEQLLLSISPKDFSFIAEDHISKIFALFTKYRTHVNLIQNSAISFSACADMNYDTYKTLIAELQNDFKVKYNDNLMLITIRHYNDEAIEKMILGKTTMLEQRSRSTVRFVVKA